MQVIEWQCKHCKDILYSSDQERWTMDSCNCGESSLDLEENYMRGFGDIEIINDFLC